MTKKEAMRQTAQENALLSLGFTREEAESLRRISMTLHRWHERECGTDGGCIIRTEAGEAMWLSSHSNLSTPIRDAETGAKRRLAAIITARNAREYHPIKPDAVTAYVQTDPRGAALYILRPGDVLPGESADSCYSRGICVC